MIGRYTLKVFYGPTAKRETNMHQQVVSDGN